MTRAKATVPGLAAAALVLGLGAPTVYAEMPAAAFENFNQRAFALGEINGYLSMCGAADALHHRAVIVSEATAAGASQDQIQTLRYAFNKGLSAGATAAPLQFKGCTKEFYRYLEQKNEALGALDKQRSENLPKK